jgi:hypothetical protein
MTARTMKLTMHTMPSGQVYWALSIDTGRGRRFVVARGVLEDLDQGEHAPLFLILQESALAARRELRGE